jgi:(4-(4-[2-(gamma-L-glutamylamino)ethyl]phenoxymethyl)furan-2-yl)methanamine synthase
MSVVAIDVGGANLKAADGREFALARPFALWRSPERLTAELGELLRLAPPHRCLVATMTGELADCFATKAEGVRFIVAALEQAGGRANLKIYLTDGTLADPQEAMENPLVAAASNWHATATFAGRFAPGGGALVLDLGSTTCDITPLINGLPVAVGRTDPQRLVNGELVYTGVERSPVCAVVRSLPWRGQTCPVAQELFATTWDAYLSLDDLPEEPDSTHTADGRPATRSCARDRLARAICADREMFDERDAMEAASTIAAAQLEQLHAAVVTVAGRMAVEPQMAVICGQGEFLLRRLLERWWPALRVVSLTERLGPNVSRVAPAHALAVLAREREIA